MKQITDWHKLYNEGWKGEIMPEAFKHPAKYSRALIRHIYQHMRDEGWIEPGDQVIDPFGGVGLGALDAMRLGLNWTGIELEPAFHVLGNENIALWNSRYRELFPGWGTARLLNGDSRGLVRLVGGECEAAVSSPPYADGGIHQGGEDTWFKDSQTEKYGTTPGQLGAMKAGDFDASVSSPPFENGLPQQDRNFSAPHDSSGNLNVDYGTTDGNIGNATGDTFWTAARAIVEQVYTALRPGGHAAWVVKAFVKNKQIQDFPGQWQALCESVGFITLHEHRAWLVEHRGTQFDMDGNGHSKQVERKSFFRRLAEQKGSPRIDFEVVLCMMKPEAA